MHIRRIKTLSFRHYLFQLHTTDTFRTNGLNEKLNPCPKQCFFRSKVFIFPFLFFKFQLTVLNWVS